MDPQAPLKIIWVLIWGRSEWARVRTHQTPNSTVTQIIQSARRHTLGTLNAYVYPCEHVLTRVHTFKAEALHIAKPQLHI